MYFDVQLEILSFMFLVSICTHFLVLFWSDDCPSCGRNWSPFNKHNHKSVLVVTGVFLDCFIHLWEPHTAFVLRPSIWMIQRKRWLTAVRNWLYGAEFFWRRWQVLSWSKI